LGSNSWCYIVDYIHTRFYRDFF